jgi:hypothetical protein
VGSWRPVLRHAPHRRKTWPACIAAARGRGETPRAPPEPRALLRRFVLALVLVLLLAAGGGILWLLLRDPLAALPKPDPAPALLARRDAFGETRLRSFVRLGTETLGPVGLVVDRPIPFRDRLPVIVVLGGLGTAARNIDWIREPGENALVGYDWPIPTAMPNGLDLLAAAPDLYRSALAIPGQIQTAMAWAAAQDWADPDRISLLGFSLGALAAPAAQRLGPVAPGWTVLAYGGTPLGPLIAANPHLEPRWIAPLLSLAADLMLRPLEPGAHLPHLSGRFLVLEGAVDEFVPAAAAARFRDLTPDPKRVVAFPGGHMGVGPSQIELLEQIIAESRAWLIAQGAANPP